LICLAGVVDEEEVAEEATAGCDEVFGGVSVTAGAGVEETAAGVGVEETGVEDTGVGVV